MNQEKLKEAIKQIKKDEEKFILCKHLALILEAFLDDNNGCNHYFVFSHSAQETGNTIVYYSVCKKCRLIKKQSEIYDK